MAETVTAGIIGSIVKIPPMILRQAVFIDRSRVVGEAIGWLKRAIIHGNRIEPKAAVGALNVAGLIECWRYGSKADDYVRSIGQIRPAVGIDSRLKITVAETGRLFSETRQVVDNVNTVQLSAARAVKIGPCAQIKIDCDIARGHLLNKAWILLDLSLRQ